ncbi:hypothetical protein P4234_07815 [Pseudomonas aeruginosa]|nr:hypothetical protein [Pseudomonas aeruginosa]
MDFHAGGPDPRRLRRESLVGALLGGLSGLALGQAVSLQNLAQQNERLRKQMSEFAERFERGTEVIHQRLLRVERQAQDLPESVPEPAAGIDQPLADTPPAPPAEVAPPLDWDIELPAVEAAPPPPRPPEPVQPIERQPAFQPDAQPAPRRAAPPAPPREPSLVERGFAAAKGWLFGGNTVLRIGVVLLFIGLAFLLRLPRNGWRCRWSTATPGWRWQRWRCSASAGGCASGAPPTA